MKWLERHSAALQALGNIVMAIVAVAALIGVKLQVDAAYSVQREQSAKEIYREFLNISIANPDLAQPNYCSLSKSPRAPAYDSYVEYLLYTAEQVLQASPDWVPVFEAQLVLHQETICGQSDWSSDSPDVEALAMKFKAGNCKQLPDCE